MKLIQFLVEGGAALKGSSPISQPEARKLAKELTLKVAHALGISPNKVALVGSGGKKPEGDSGDIDLAVQATPGEVSAALDQLTDGPSRVMSSIGTYSFAAKHGDGFVQVDLVPTKSIEYVRWSMGASTEDLAQGLKGAHRNELLFAIPPSIPKTKEQKDENGELVSYERVFYDLRDGLMSGVKTRLKEKGKLAKNFKTTEKKTISLDPDKVTHQLFGDHVDAADVATFEGALNAIMATEFEYAESRDKILERAKLGIEKKGLEVPESLMKAISA